MGEKPRRHAPTGDDQRPRAPNTTHNTRPKRNHPVKYPVKYPAMSDLFVTWDEYHRHIETLGAKIYQSGWQFDQILCLARGGLRVGDTLSRIFDLPLAILSASSYGGENYQKRGELQFGASITMTTSSLGKRLLLVDDLVDSGITLVKTLDWLKQHPEHCPDQIRTAVLWYKQCSIAVPDYYVDYLPDNPWIHQPFERYERMEPSELVIL